MDLGANIFFRCLILQVVLALGDYMSVQCHACIGGTNLGEDIRKLDYGQVGSIRSVNLTLSHSCLARFALHSTLWLGRQVVCLI